MSEIATWVKLLVELGMEVWKAIEAGDDTKTVGEIFAGRRKDMDKIRELEERAREHFSRPG